MLLEALRTEVVEAGVKLAQAQLVQLSCGNVSARDPDTNLIAIKPGGADYFKLRPVDVLVVDEQGAVVDGEGKPSSETPMHTLVYRSRRDIHAAIHTHSAIATAWSVAQRAIPCVTVGQVLTDGAIPVAPYCQPGTEALGEVALRAMGSGSAVVLQNHGVFTVGANMKMALAAAFIVEEAALVAFYAEMLGDTLHLLGKQDLQEMLRRGTKG